MTIREVTARDVTVLVGPGEGWGTGAHPTTRLCLQAVVFLGRAGTRVLDFGAGSGILAIAAAKLGARVDAIEIDPAGIAHGEANARLNGVSDRVTYARELPERAPCELVVANILRPILLEHADELAARVAPGGAIVLSGLVATDVPEVEVRFSRLLGGARAESYRQGEWHAVVLRRPAA